MTHLHEAPDPGEVSRTIARFPRSEACHDDKATRIVSTSGDTVMAHGLTLAAAKNRHSMKFSSLNYKAIFEAYPDPGVVLAPDDHFPILAANDQYLQRTGTGREDLLGQGFFEVFPADPSHPRDPGVSAMRASFARVIRNKKPDFMGIQKYDIPRRDGRGGFKLNYWIPINAPVIEADGGVAYIIHKILDVTDFAMKAQASAAGLLDDINLGQHRLGRLAQALADPVGPGPEDGRPVPGLIPICAWCQKVRTAHSSWEGLAEFVSRHLGVSWTHGICPDCRSKVFQESNPGA